MRDDSGLGLLKGTLELLVMKTLGSEGELHGFEILDWIRETTQEELVVEEGALYPALHRMESRGLLESSWGVSAKGRRAKYYRLTKQGVATLDLELERWNRYVTAVGRIRPRPNAV